MGSCLAKFLAKIAAKMGQPSSIQLSSDKVNIKLFVLVVLRQKSTKLKYPFLTNPSIHHPRDVDVYSKIISYLKQSRCKGCFFIFNTTFHKE